MTSFYVFVLCVTPQGQRAPFLYQI